MWQYNQSQELTHFGVMGMKWGKRTGVGKTISNRKEKRIDKKLAKVDSARKFNKSAHQTMNAESRYMYGNKKDKLKSSLAGNKALYDTSEVTNKFRAAKLQAKKDPNYKNSSEYKKTKAAYAKQHAQQVVYGTVGHQHIETLKNKGYSEKRAKGETAAIEIVGAIGMVALGSIASMYARN